MLQLICFLNRGLQTYTIFVYCFDGEVIRNFFIHSFQPVFMGNINNYELHWNDVTIKIATNIYYTALFILLRFKYRNYNQEL